MKLGSLLKLGSVLKSKLLEAVHAPEDRHAAQNAGYTAAYGSKGVACNPEDHAATEDHTAVILEEKKKQIRIACWSCAHPQWVKRGSKCHRLGLCGNCVRAIDSVSEDRASVSD